MNKINANRSSVKVLPLGPFIVDDTHAINLYYIEKSQNKILIDFAPIQVSDLMKLAIQKHIEIHQLTHIVIMNVMMSSINVIIDLVDEGFKGTIITNEYIARQIKNALLPVNLVTIEDLRLELMQGDQTLLSFIPMVFLPYPDMFMAFEPETKTLFSSHLMSSYYQGDIEPDLSDLQKLVFTYHKEMMPSSDFVKPIIRQIEHLHPTLILPSYGYYIDSLRVKPIMELMKQIDFHNNYFMNHRLGNAPQDVNHIEIINQLIATLNKHFPRIEILNTFVGSPFHLDSDTLLVKKTSLVNYKMWHQFFDHVYAKRGMTWLTLMEPTMQKLMERYHLELPSIYRTETLKLKEEARLLEEKKQQLETDLHQLIKQVEEAKDQVVRDPLTHLYIQDMLKQLMVDHFQTSVPSGMTRGLMLIHLDQLLQINRRYGKETGDESLRNLVYVLDQVKKEHVMLFKQSGPGIFALIEEDKKANIIEEAVRFRNAVAESTNFIEEVTASIAVVTCSEVDFNLPFEDRLSFLFKTLEKRMAFAKITGHGSIIDESVELPEPAEGAILLVDQDEVNRNMLYRLFKRIKYDVILADSVVEGYKILEKRPIDIVISEINLSKMDGFQLKMMMNESKAFRKIPFIMVSHNKTVDNIKRGNMLDVDLILEKPITPEELIGHVKRMKDRVK